MRLLCPHAEASTIRHERLHHRVVVARVYNSISEALAGVTLTPEDRLLVNQKLTLIKNPSLLTLPPDAARSSKYLQTQASPRASIKCSMHLGGSMPQSFWVSRLLCLSVLLPITAAAQQAPTQAAPDWQIKAGGKQQFEVASVRDDPSGKWVPPPFSFDADDAFKDTGGLFTADANLATYISFAYKLPIQYNLLSGLPEWAKKEHFVIQARAEGNPTKDQVRLMMQSLLADRFKLALHYEMQDRTVLAMTLAKPGTFGQRLRLHADGLPCSVVTPRPKGAQITFDMFPCDVILMANEPDNVLLAGARDTTVELMDAFFSNVGGFGCQVVNRTGIQANIDFSMEFTREPRGGGASSADGQASLPGTSFVEAIREQLGLKLEPAKAPVQVPVVDHIEMPSAN